MFLVVVDIVVLSFYYYYYYIYIYIYIYTLFKLGSSQIMPFIILGSY
ncbi:hypothetical protein K7X86_00480 [Candidatus Sulcia muelleri]|nr:hypothetical protein [Candidatus Karelsulcia muelleri]